MIKGKNLSPKVLMRNFKLTIEFVGEISEELQEGTEHEKLFWNAFKSDMNALDDYYLCHYLEVFKELVFNFNVVTEEIFSREDKEILQSVFMRLPEKTVHCLNNSMEPGTPPGYISDRLFMKLHNQFLPPKVIDSQVLSTVEIDKLYICRLKKPTLFDLKCANILIRGSSHRLVVVEKVRIFDGKFNTLDEAKDGFFKLFGDRGEVLPVWGAKEDG